MSRTTIYEVTPTSIKEIAEFRNSWGSAPVLWDYLCREYLGKPNGMSFLSDDSKYLWRLWRHFSVPRCLRAMLLMTFDAAIVKKENFAEAAQDIRQGIKIIQPPSEHVNHWPAIADLFEKGGFESIGIRCTSVSNNPFVVYDEDSDEDDEAARKIVINLDVYEELSKAAEDDIS